MTSVAVLDASAGVYLVRDDRRADRVREWLLDCPLVIAPRLYATEVANALWKSAVAEPRPPTWVYPSFQAALDLVGTFHDDEQLIAEALPEAIARRHPVYDCLYLILTRRHGARLLTFDRRLSRLARDMNLEVLNPLDS